MIKVVIVEDNKTIRLGLAALIDGTENFVCKETFGTGEALLKNLPEIDVDVVLMDIGLPGMNGIDVVKEALAIKNTLNILMLTVYEDNERVFQALCAGACGYLVKKTPPAKLLEAIEDASIGGSPMSSNIARKVITVFQETQKLSDLDQDYNLSDREIMVLRLLADGNNYQEIAENIFISVDTVRHHIRNIYKKLHVHSQSQAVAKAIRKGLI